MECTRINKYLADCGICSRREAEKLVLEGRIRVGDRLAQNGDKVTEQDRVYYNGKEVKPKKECIVIAFYKPVGVMCSEKDPYAKKLVKDYIHIKERVTYAGRLDKDSEGLLLLTNDGYLIEHMMKASNLHEKEYVVKVNKEIDEAFVRKMSDGMHLKELNVDTRPCKVVKEGKYTFRITLTQGFNRQIRRMCKECGMEVRSLKRVRVMSVELGNLKPGEYRRLTEEEIKKLRGAE